MLSRLRNDPLRQLVLVFFAGLVMKVLFWNLVPLLDDEAYFIEWARHLDYGYYDHPPMVGWINYLMRFVADNYLWYRAFAVLTTIVATAVIMAPGYRRDPRKAAVIGMIYWLSLPSLLSFPMLNDTCLLFFTVISLHYFIKYVASERKVHALLAGLWWGGAFLSKYLAVFTAVAYAVALLIHKPKKVLEFAGLAGLAALPLIAINGLWNYNNCYSNILFNFFNRVHLAADFSLDKLLLTLVALLGPQLIWILYRIFRDSKLRESKVPVTLFAVPLLLYGLVSLHKLVGAHWVLPSLIPAYFILNEATQEQLTKVLKYSIIYAGLICTCLVVLLLGKDKIFTPDRVKYSTYLYVAHPDEVCAIFQREVPPNYALLTIGYPPSAILGHMCKYEIPTIFALGVHGRQNDKTVDMQKYAGKNIAIYYETESATRMGEFFKSYETKEIPLRKGSVKLLLGREFDFVKYRQEILTIVQKSYYTNPSWLPKARACYFTDRYFPTL